MYSLHLKRTKTLRLHVHKNTRLSERSVLTFFCCPQVERMPILIDSPKKLDHQLSSDPDKTPVSNAANSDSEPEDLNPPGAKVAD